ncbi:MAG: hypothetical protein ABL927_10470 [Bdellovibrionales bacterium]
MITGQAFYGQAPVHIISTKFSEFQLSATYGRIFGIQKLNADADDVHSSDFFRLLHLEFLKNGKLSSECLQALMAKNEKAQFSNCAAK